MHSDGFAFVLFLSHLLRTLQVFRGSCQTRDALLMHGIQILTATETWIVIYLSAILLYHPKRALSFLLSLMALCHHAGQDAIHFFTEDISLCTFTQWEEKIYLFFTFSVTRRVARIFDRQGCPLGKKKREKQNKNISPFFSFFLLALRHCMQVAIRQSWNRTQNWCVLTLMKSPLVPW